jgi:hypothetical protein
MKEKPTKESSLSELTDEQLTERISAAKNDGDVLEEIAEVNRRKQHVETTDD